MILKTLYLKMDGKNLPVDYTYGFLKQSRCLCNYLEREVLKKLKFACDGFNRIVICLVPTPGDDVYVNSCQVACVEIQVDHEEYTSKQGHELAIYYIAKLREGLMKCAQSVPIPLEALLQGIDDFIAGGMKNRWIHRSKKLGGQGLKAELDCELTLNEFILRIRVYQGPHLLLDEVVLQTDPDEIAFAFRFHDLVVLDGVLTVTSKNTDSPWSRRLDQVLDKKLS